MSVASIGENVLQQRELDNEHYMNNKFNPLVLRMLILNRLSRVDSDVFCYVYDGDMVIVRVRPEYLERKRLYLKAYEHLKDKLCVWKKAEKFTQMKLIKTLGNIRERQVFLWLVDAFPVKEGWKIKQFKNMEEPDFIVYDANDRPFMAIEVKNMGERSFMLEKDFHKIIERLCKYSYFKLLILSSGYNLIRKKQTYTSKGKLIYTYNTNIRKTSEELRSKGIYTWILGYQHLLTMKDLDQIISFVKRKRENTQEVIGWID